MSSGIKITGHYLDGKSAKRRAALLELDPEPFHHIGLTIEADVDSGEGTALQGAARSFTLSFDDLRIESRLGNTPREIGFGDEQLFVTDDNDAVDRLVARFGTTGWLHLLESKLSFVILAVVLTVALVGSFVHYGIPAGAKWAAEKLPVVTAEYLGDGLDILDKTVFDPSEIALSRQQEVRDLLEPYLQQYPELDAKINFRAGLEANALALPTGDIVFTDEFIRLVKHDDELVAVFFHELGHLHHRHMMRRVLQDSMITLLVIMVTGDVDTVDMVTGLPTLILDLAYSRAFEVEADAYALEKMHESGIELENFAVIMQRLEDYYYEGGDEEEGGFKIPAFLSTHPATEERVQLAQQLIERYRRTSH